MYLEVVTQDRYERLVAVVYLQDVRINEWLVEAGHAWAYRQYLKDPIYCEREHEARLAKRGIWSQPADQIYAPWEWRHYKRGQSDKITQNGDESVAKCIAAIGIDTAASQRPGGAESKNSGECQIKGNISANGRIYHVPGSRSYDATRVDESRGERWFCSEEEARAAGWRAPIG